MFEAGPASEMAMTPSNAHDWTSLQQLKPNSRCCAPECYLPSEAEIAIQCLARSLPYITLCIREESCSLIRIQALASVPCIYTSIRTWSALPIHPSVLARCAPFNRLTPPSCIPPHHFLRDGNVPAQRLSIVVVVAMDRILSRMVSAQLAGTKAVVHARTTASLYLLTLTA